MQPQRIDLGDRTPPAAVVAGLTVEDHPAVLWGDGWFGGGVLIGLRPERYADELGAAEAIELLGEQPEIDPEALPEDFVGGGWLGVLGYGDGTSILGWYDSLLRWRPRAGWSFEALGLPGREEAYAAALADWRARLAAPAAAPDWSCGEFATTLPPDRARDRHLAGVEETIRRIAAGDFYQLNLCTRLYADFTGSAPAMFAAMADELQPVRGGLIGSPGASLASFSPELFLAVESATGAGSTVRTSPIKGTAPRRPGDMDSPHLRASVKDRAENIMIVDLMRNDLARVAVPGTVGIEELLTLEPHPGVWHLISTVSANLPPTADMTALLHATFPPGSVTGAPKSAALVGIAEIESEPRGAYTGAFGLCGPIRSELNVVIRSFEITEARIELGVGGGITADGVPMLEWRECLHKAAPLIGAAGSRLVPGLDLPESAPPVADPAAGVFETMRALDGRIPWLAEHLARLDRSCRELYQCGLPDRLPTELFAPAAESGAETVRVHARLVGGTLQVTVTRTPFGGGSTAGPAITVHRPAGLWRHKWSDRGWLNGTEQAAGAAVPLFVADDGVLLETSRGNLFLQTESGRWLTPPLRDDLLPGVTRRAVLELAPRFGVPIAIEPPHHDTAYRSAFWTSSLSGIVPITAIDDQQMQPLPPEMVALGNGLG